MRKLAAIHLSALLASAVLAGAAQAAPRFSCPDVEAGKIEGNYFKNRIFQGLDGWFYREGSDVQDFYSYGPDTLSFIGRFASALKQRDVQLVVMPVPPKGIIDAEFAGPSIGADTFDPHMATAEMENLLVALKGVGVLPVDVIAASAATKQANFFFARDLHWRPEGAQIGAQAVRKALEADPTYAELSKKTYQTSVVAKDQPMRSAVLQALQRMCVDTLPQERTDLYETAAGEATADDLLGGDAATPVALVGTSFSDLETFNFAGFLSQALELEVANFAVSGGGSFTSILGYTMSNSLEEMPPKFLVWENPAYNRLDADGIGYFRQIIPATLGYCEGAARLTETKLSLPAGATKVFPVPAGAKDITGHDYYLAIRASDPGIKHMTIDVDYADGDGETFVINRSDRQKPSERFFLEFSDDIPASVSRVTIAAAPDRAVDLDIQLCHAPQGGQL